MLSNAAASPQRSTHVARPGRIVVDRKVFLWEVREGAADCFPGATKHLAIWSEAGDSEFLLAMTTSSPDTRHEIVWIGPAYIRAAGEAFPRVAAGLYYLLPAFRTTRGPAVDNEDVRSIVDRLLSGRRLRRVRPDGMPPGWCDVPRTVTPRRLLDAVLWWARLWVLFAVSITVGSTLAWLVGGRRASITEHAVVTAAIVAFLAIFATLMVWSEGFTRNPMRLSREARIPSARR